MTLTEDLIEEHNAIEEMLFIMNKIAVDIDKDKGFDTEDVEKIIYFLRTFVDKCHHGKEETLLFPALAMKGIHEDSERIETMLQEHNVGRGYVNGLIEGVADFKRNFVNSDRLISACLTNYANLLHSHIQKEENVLFPITNKVLSEQKRMEILEQLKIFEEKVLGQADIEKNHKLLKELKFKYPDSSDF